MKTLNTSKLYTTNASGVFGTSSYALYLCDRETQRKVSFIHDIPYRAKTGLFHAVIETSQHTTYKMEVDNNEKFNPIKHDMKKGKVRQYEYPVDNPEIKFNYGMIPQTHEDPDELDEYTNYPGDGDPVDVFELSGDTLQSGQVVRVKIIGAFDMIDQDETDYKICTLHEGSELFYKCDSMVDLEKHRPGTIDMLKDWIINYKTPSGKPQNKLFTDNPLSKEQAESIVHMSHLSYLSKVPYQ